ncbi:phage terminase small subunit [Paenibacillus eucommiae]|uniref:Uncharacterized protein YjcR n=1 Tax=Paenibacillus eucommiae TaxID=1355755 RepID=A0ABS4IYA0_9BACL|nr:phage terminase small subunit [Paenibacillus eucommiae]MBP1992535.1 uncharacterized protein YjcR [Paenibacillus eucommiae]
MSRGRSPDRDRAFKIWCESGRKMKPSEIAFEMGLNASLIRKWKSLDRWDEQPDPLPRSRGAPTGNKNAVGNRGGPGGPLRNQKAFKTGEYATIWLDTLEADEKILLFEVETDPIAQIENEIRLLDLRERRMLQLRAKVLEGWDADNVSSKSELFRREIGEQPKFDGDGNIEMVPVYEESLKEIERTIKTPQKLERILAIEDALTRVQDKKGKYLDLKYKVAAKALTEEEQQLRIEKLKAEVKAMNEKAW